MPLIVGIVLVLVASVLVLVGEVLVLVLEATVLETSLQRDKPHVHATLYLHVSLFLKAIQLLLASHQIYIIKSSNAHHKITSVT